MKRFRLIPVIIVLMFFSAVLVTEFEAYGIEQVSEVTIDIKPGSCPNPIILVSKGILPIAILGLGTEVFDVTTIDPFTIKLERESVNCSVAPLRWGYEDVATPFEGELCDCHDLNVDGYLDLKLQFDNQEVVDCLELKDIAGETVTLILTGNLKEEYGGTPIRGEDCMQYIFKCHLNPDTTVIPRGETLGFQGSVTNYTDKSATALFAAKVTLPSGNKYPPSGYLIGPVEIALTPYQSKSGYKSNTIPPAAQLGTYTYHGYVGNFGEGIYHECTFEFEVTQ